MTYQWPNEELFYSPKNLVLAIQKIIEDLSTFNLRISLIFLLKVMILKNDNAKNYSNQYT